jgi:hypothetical protein
LTDGSELEDAFFGDSSSDSSHQYLVGTHTQLSSDSVAPGRVKPKRIEVGSVANHPGRSAGDNSGYDLAIFGVLEQFDVRELSRQPFQPIDDGSFGPTVLFGGHETVAGVYDDRYTSEPSDDPAENPGLWGVSVQDVQAQFSQASPKLTHRAEVR